MTEVEPIGRYQILGELGRGAMGVVYRAHDPVIGRTVAIKTIRLGASARPGDREENLERLRREAQSAGKLSHPGIVTVYDMIESGDALYVCMECVEGPTLESLMAARRTFSRETVLSLLRQIAGALDYAHSRGIVHRDVKPGNVMLHEDRLVKITDFGIAKILSEETTMSGPMLGTPSYMSPEQIQSRPVGGRSDQFSLAVIAYELLTGEKPFRAFSLASIVYKVCNEPAPPASQANPCLPTGVDAALDRALSKDPMMRYADARQFIGDVEAALAPNPNWIPLPRGEQKERPTTGEEESLTSTVPRPSRRVSRAAAWLFGLAGFLATASIVWFAIPQEQPAVVLPPPAPVASPPPAQALETKPSPAEETKAPEPATGEPKEVPADTAGTQPASLVAHDFRVESVPDGATVTVDDISGFTCKSPCKLTLAAGRHTLKIEREGYRPALRIINVPDQALAHAALERRTGTVMVRSNPPGAVIVVDGKEWPSRTPTMMTLPIGKHKIELRKEGLRDDESVIEVRDGAVMNLDVNWTQNP